jgi:hypothetical protein
MRKALLVCDMLVVACGVSLDTVGAHDRAGYLLSYSYSCEANQEHQSRHENNRDSPHLPSRLPFG